MADTNILSDFGINILEEEIDDVIFQTNEFLCDATFTGSQGSFWWLLVVVDGFREIGSISNYKSITYKILSRFRFFKRDKNGTKLGKNISFDILSSCPRFQRPLSFGCKGTNFPRDKRRESPKSFICSRIFFFTFKHCHLRITQIVFSEGGFSCNSK